jgi:hypothetical protein
MAQSSGGFELAVEALAKLQAFVVRQSDGQRLEDDETVDQRIARLVDDTSRGSREFLDDAYRPSCNGRSDVTALGKVPMTPLKHNASQRRSGCTTRDGMRNGRDAFADGGRLRPVAPENSTSSQSNGSRSAPRLESVSRHPTHSNGNRPVYAGWKK